MLATVATGSVRDADRLTSGAALTQALNDFEGVTQAASFWSLGQAPPLASDSGTTALVLVRIAGDEDDVDATKEALIEHFGDEAHGFELAYGGSAVVFGAVGTTIEEDLARAEMIAVPITLVLLLLVFGSVVAALLPLLVGAIAVLGTFLTLFTIASVTDVSIFSINLTTALGLGLAIDYSLFIVSRYREEVAAGLDREDAVIRTVETAGRTVAFSAVTVAVSLAALLIFPLYFLRSFAYAGIAVVAIAAVAAVVSLPALLAVLGPRVDRGRIRRRRGPVSPTSTGFWYRMATWVMRRPARVAAVVIVFLLVLGAPFLGASFGLPDHRVLPEDAPAREVSQRLRAEFSSDESEAFGVVIRSGNDGRLPESALATTAVEISMIDGVARVDAATGSYVDGVLVAGPGPASARFAASADGWVSVVPAVEMVSPEGERVVHAIRGLEAEHELLVSGRGAQLVDSKDTIFALVPVAGALIALSTFVLLF
jgi:RND superfamily putative drug exporter